MLERIAGFFLGLFAPIVMFFGAIFDIGGLLRYRRMRNM